MARVTAGRAAVDHPWLVLAAWLIAWTTVEILLSRTHMYSWHYVLTGAGVMRSPVWFTVYGRHPELQMGPLTFLAAEPISLLPKEAGRVVAAASMASVGLLIVREIRTLVPPASAADHRRWMLVSAVLLVGWLEVAVRFGHLDDVMALLCALVALRCARAQRPLRAGLLIGLAIDCKPWAVPFAAVLLVLPGGLQRARSVAVAIAVVVVVWAPFLVLDPHVLDATRFVIHVDAASTLHLLGIAAESTPPWCRPAQIVVGTVLAVAAVRSGRWPAVVIVVIASRLLLDPAVQPYYDSGLLIGAAILDFATTSGRWSLRSGLATGTVLLLVYLPSYLVFQLPELRGLLRTAGLVGLIALGFALRPLDRAVASGADRSCRAHTWPGSSSRRGMRGQEASCGERS